MRTKRKECSRQIHQTDIVQDTIVCDKGVGNESRSRLVCVCSILGRMQSSVLRRDHAGEEDVKLLQSVARPTTLYGAETGQCQQAISIKCACVRACLRACLRACVCAKHIYANTQTRTHTCIYTHRDMHLKLLYLLHNRMISCMLSSQISGCKPMKCTLPVGIQVHDRVDTP